MVTAMPPIDPICESSTARSGVLALTASVTSRPFEQTVKEVSGDPSAATTSSRTHWASVATRMCTTATLVGISQSTPKQTQRAERFEALVDEFGNQRNPNPWRVGSFLPKGFEVAVFGTSLIGEFAKVLTQSRIERVIIG